MIDWMTLRTPASYFLQDMLFDKFHKFVGKMTIENAQGEILRSKPVFDVDMVRSDSAGLYWSFQSDGKQTYLCVGASPASIEFNNNVFGSSDVAYCANLLISKAQELLGVTLPSTSFWQCRRLDITHNYLLDSHSQVKQALRELRKGDGVRQKASVPKGDTVYWGQGSDLKGGKAYDKGSQIEYMQKLQEKRKLKNTVFTPSVISRLKCLLRLELSLKRRWFDRHGEDWLNLTAEKLDNEHEKFFNQFIGKLEVTDMGTLLEELRKVTPTEGQALAAHKTWALIKAIGYEQTIASMPRATFSRHMRSLKAAGLSHADLQNANVIPFRRQTVTISAPVRSWDELLRAA